jgi:Do/DeqQ family serine protease
VKKNGVLLILSILACSCLTPMYNLQSSFRKVADGVIPSVVQVNVVEITTQQIPKGGDGPWDFFFPNPEDEDSPSEKEFRMQGLGSGVILDSDGSTYYVLTNNHVIGEGAEITVTLHDKRMFSAKVIGKDPRRDIAMISFQSDEGDIIVADTGNSENLQVGDWVVAIGNPFGLDSTVTAGIVSGLHRSGPTDIADFIQTDASINQGNSGGALVNLTGEVVGINTWIQTPTGGSIGLGFAIPINSAVKAVKDFKSFGEVRYGWLGVTLTEPGAVIIKEYGYDKPAGAFITNVYTNSPGFKSGLRPGDLITGVNGKMVNNVDHLIYMLGDISIGDSVKIEYFRNKEKVYSDVQLELRKPDTEIREMHNEVWPGFSVYPLNTELLSKLSLDAGTQGVFVISVEERTIADSAGLKTGDIIQKINGKGISRIGGFYSSINDDSGSYTLSVLREGEAVDITMTLENNS